MRFTSAFFPSPRFFYLRQRFTLFSAMAIFIGIISGGFAAAEQAASKPLQERLQEVEQRQARWESQRQSFVEKVEEARNSGAGDIALRQHLSELATQFIFSEKTRHSLTEKTKQARALLQQNKEDEAEEILQALDTRYLHLEKDFFDLQKTLEAEKRAEQTRADAKMYFMMRVRSAVPPKTLKAYGIMELAKQERDKGNFGEALNLWSQAEVMVRESFNEHIASMAEWHEQAAKEEEQQQAVMRKKVETLFANYFVDVPAGEFLMGSRDGGVDEAPQHKVKIPPFKIGKTEVTFELYDLCVASTRCYAKPNDQGWGRGSRPVINVSHRDITQQFLPWLNALTGKRYRLPSEAEWEYAARAGSSAEYAWGDNLTCAMARFDGGSASVCNAREGKNRGTAPVASYKPNAFGLYDMHGNVWEWVEDCWHPNYAGAPTDGSAWLSENCEVRVLRGGSWDYSKNGLRSANRYYFPQKVRKPSYGFRLALDIER